MTSRYTFVHRELYCGKVAREEEEEEVKKKERRSKRREESCARE